MSYLTKDGDGLTCFSDKARNDYKNTPLEYKDGVLMDMLGEMTFGCGKTRWDSPILFTHIDSRKIVVAVKCPVDMNGWDGCPYSKNPNHLFAFVHEQGYEIRIMDVINEFKAIIYEAEFSSQPYGKHWLDLPQNIRDTWASSFWASKGTSS